MSGSFPEIDVRFERQESDDITIASFPDHEISSLVSVDLPMRQFEDEIRDRKPKALVIDFHGITYLASTAITMLLVILKKVRATGGEVYICSLAGTILKVFQTMQLTKLFPIFPNRQAALAAAASAQR